MNQELIRAIKLGLLDLSQREQLVQRAKEDASNKPRPSRQQRRKMQRMARRAERKGRK